MAWYEREGEGWNRLRLSTWVGNADGEGRPGLTGTEAAAPILFDLFSSLPDGKWFSEPASEMSQVPVCAKSGYRLTEVCEKADTIWVTRAGLQTAACKCGKHRSS